MTDKTPASRLGRGFWIGLTTVTALALAGGSYYLAIGKPPQGTAVSANPVKAEGDVRQLTEGHLEE
jgi:hypothetical protein